ncbi:MAG: alternative ribosome rescue aminoacyl-tRNA hydrolase ArfB [Planctomycetia bacterium]|nr:alternative ribosome rescue aminoacyl-tRNA hydrolase ArfB [Planctomycetia bacterium]
MEESNVLVITEEIGVPLASIRFSYVRSSGPGGQNVNKVSSKAVMRWNIIASGLFSPETIERFAKLFPACYTTTGDIIITSQESRDAPKNKQLCLDKLRYMLQVAVRVPTPRKPTRPTRASVRRRLDDKAKHAKKKELRKKNFDQ